jgi:hypothetical protein
MSHLLVKNLILMNISHVADLKITDNIFDHIVSFYKAKQCHEEDCILMLNKYVPSFVDFYI